MYMKTHKILKKIHRRYFPSSSNLIIRVYKNLTRYLIIRNPVCWRISRTLLIEPLNKSKPTSSRGKIIKTVMITRRENLN